MLNFQVMLQGLTVNGYHMADHHWKQGGVMPKLTILLLTLNTFVFTFSS